MKLKLNEDHKYLLDGVKIPGFSEICKDLKITDFSTVDPYILDQARELGTNVHLALEWLDNGTLDEETTPSYLLPYINSYMNFLHAHNATVLDVELKCWGFPMDEEKNLYACTLDRTFLIDDFKWVIDIKTGGKYRSTRLQTAANLCAFNNDRDFALHATRRGALYLDKDGGYKLDPHEEDSDIMRWLECVNIFWFKHPKYGGKS